MTEPVSIKINTDLPAGPWDAQITLHSGLVERSAQAELTFPAAGASPAVPTMQPVPDRTGPSPGAVVFVALLLLAALLALPAYKWMLVRRRQATPPHAVSADSPAGTDRGPLVASDRGSGRPLL